MSEHATSTPGKGAAIQVGKSAQHDSHACLDLVRGLAALAVAGGHLRSFIFVDFGYTENVNVLWKLFYFLTGLGHEAVMVFFVMSGFLIGKQVYNTVGAGQWDWSVYAIKRLSRLWVVLIPALALNALWDYVGIYLYHGSLYAGLLNDVNHSTPSPGNVTLTYGFNTFLANTFFLQTIVAPTFGTNTPLWSLANEFWYYVIFPLGCLASQRAVSVAQRIIFAGLAMAICVVLPMDIILYGMIWMFGFGVVMIQELTKPSFSPTALRTFTALSAALFLAAIASTKLLPPNHLNDFICGGTFACFLYFLTKIRARLGIVRKLSKTLAEFSYTLYLTHFPLLALLSCTVLRGQRFQPGLGLFVLYFVFFVAMTAYAYFIYVLFERNTGQVQAVLMDCLGRGRGITIRGKQDPFGPASTLGSHLR